MTRSAGGFARTNASRRPRRLRTPVRQGNRARRAVPGRLFPTGARFRGYLTARCFDRTRARVRPRSIPQAGSDASPDGHRPVPDRSTEEAPIVPVVTSGRGRGFAGGCSSDVDGVTRPRTSDPAATAVGGTRRVCRRGAGRSHGRPGGEVGEPQQVPPYQAGSPSIVESSADGAVRSPVAVQWCGFGVLHKAVPSVVRRSSRRVGQGAGQGAGAGRRFKVPGPGHGSARLIARCERSTAGSADRRCSRSGNKVVSDRTRRGPLGHLAACAVRRPDLCVAGDRGIATVHSGSTPTAGKSLRCGAAHVPRARRARPRTTSSLVAPPAGLEPAT